jgi:hypothetical protein
MAQSIYQKKEKSPGPRGKSRDPGPGKKVQVQVGKSRYGQVFRKVAKDAHQFLCLTQECQELTEWELEQEYDRDKGKMS